MKVEPKTQVTCTCEGTCIIKRIMIAMVIVAIVVFVGLMVMFRFVDIRPAHAATLAHTTVTHQCPTTGCQKPELEHKVRETNIYHLVYVNQVDHEYYHIDSFPTEEECFDARASPDYKNFVTEAIGVEDPLLICQVSRMAFDAD